MREKRDDAEYNGSASTGADEETGEPTIVIEDEGLRLGFTQLPNYLFQVRGLSHSAKLTYALILSYAWQKEYCFPGQETLARDLEVSTRSVIEYLKELQARGLIRIQRRGLGKTNIYHVLRYPPTPEKPSSSPLSHQEVKPSSHQGLKLRAPLDTPNLSHQEVRAVAPLDAQPSAGNKNVPPAKKTKGDEKKRQKPAAAQEHAESSGVNDARSSKTAGPVAQGGLLPTDGDRAPNAGDMTPGTATARAALQAHGIRNERLLAELAADPGEVLAQIDRLQQEVARGAVANPAGWLVEAIRGRYRLIDQSDQDGTAGTEQDVGGAILARHSDSAVPATPEGRAWARVCAELRGELTPENYGRWFAPAVAQGYSGDRLTVGVPDAFHLQWLDRRLRGTIERAAARVLGDVTIAFVVAGRA